VLVERDRQLTWLEQRSCASSGAFLLVEGVSGIGKTRLLAEAARVARSRGCRVIAARATELDRHCAFGLVRRLYEPVLAAASPGEVSALLDGAAGLAGFVIRGQDPPSTIGELGVLHSLYWFTANLAARTEETRIEETRIEETRTEVGPPRPTVVIADDLHWADRGSLNYLRYLQTRAEDLPVSVIMGTRPDEPGAEQQVIDQISVDPTCEVIALPALSAAGSAAVLHDLLSPEPDPGFVQACHAAAKGNPLLLRALARSTRELDVAPTAENASKIAEFGGQAVVKHVRSRLRQLPAECTDLARALAVLGDGSALADAANLADRDAREAAGAAELLGRVHLLDLSSAGRGYLSLTLAFEHPLVRAAVYDDIPLRERMDLHARAAGMLMARGGDLERAATHLLEVAPSKSGEHATVLRGAAATALTRGAPEVAVTYLERCLRETGDGPRAELLKTLGTTAGLVDIVAGEKYLSEALNGRWTPAERAEISNLLGKNLLELLRCDDVVRVCSEAVKQLPDDDQDMRLRLESNVLCTALYQPLTGAVMERLPALRQLPESDTVGFRELDCQIARQDAFAGDRSAVARAERALRDDVLLTGPPSLLPSVISGWFCLFAADTDEAMRSVDVALRVGYERGTASTLAPAYAFRGMGWLSRGQLAEARSDLVNADRLDSFVNCAAGGPFIISLLARTLVEEGKPAEAAAALDRNPAPDPSVGVAFLLFLARAELCRLSGDHARAVDYALMAGDSFAAHGGSNPAVVAWRSEAALSLYQLGRIEEAGRYAEEELDLARGWGAPRAVGRALWVSGLIAGQPGVERLREAVNTLERTDARLEYAKSLAALGSALRRTNHRTEAKRYLTDSLELARRLGATVLVGQARSELRSLGVRPRRSGDETAESGTLTPSERRVADLANVGLSNREIAQQLFVTTKTVEVHLSNAYRKLGISRRMELRQSLAALPA
jgi:DNA-binding CsgD family transcriptional regulator